MALRIIHNNLTPEETFEVLELALAEILRRSGADTESEDLTARLVAYERQLRIALRLPVEVGY